MSFYEETTELLCYFYIQMVVEDTEKISDKITCASCGKDFNCGANVGKCWCFAVEVRAETLAELRENFEKCLCQDCLEKINYGEKEK